MQRTITITYGDQAENHRGMQVIGTRAEVGFSLADIASAKAIFEQMGATTELIDLCSLLPAGVEGGQAQLLIVRQGVNALLRDITRVAGAGASSSSSAAAAGPAVTPPTADDMLLEHTALSYDRKALMYGRVVNKHARHNLCFADEAQEPCYEEGRSRIVSFSTIPLTNHIRHSLGRIINGGGDLQAEGNDYYDITKCGIGFHGDSERLKVVAVRLGAELPIHYQWYMRGESIGRRGIFPLRHGDMYIMSQKTTGHDWKKKIIPTLRHAAGCDKFVHAA